MNLGSFLPGESLRIPARLVESGHPDRLAEDVGLNLVSLLEHGLRAVVVLSLEESVAALHEFRPKVVKCHSVHIYGMGV